MKVFCCFLLALGSLLAQSAGSVRIYSNNAIFNTVHDDHGFLISDDIAYWAITRNPDGSKTFYFKVNRCYYNGPVFEAAALAEDIPDPICTQLSESAAELLGPVQAALGDFLDQAPDVLHRIVYGNAPGLLPTDRPHLTTLQPTMPEDPQMILFDGIGLNMDKIDLNTFAISQVPVNINLVSTVSTFGVRPVNTGDSHEVWIGSPATQGISIGDFSTGRLAAGVIPTPALNAGDYPVNIVFTNDGATALEAIVYAKPDAAANNGAILVFDAIGRKLISTLALKNAPQALLMAPDALTAYSLGNNGTITYYDVLSSTADLTAPFSFATPGGVFIHPDGTRLFCVLCGDNSLDVFNLTTRQFTSTFPVAYAVHAAPVSANMSQDGSVLAITDNLNNVYVVDTRYGNLLTTYSNTSSTMVFPGAPNN